MEALILTCIFRIMLIATLIFLVFSRNKKMDAMAE